MHCTDGPGVGLPDPDEGADQLLGIGGRPHPHQQTKTLSSFTARQPIQILGKGVTSGVVVTGDGVNDTWDQFIVGVQKVENIF